MSARNLMILAAVIAVAVGLFLVFGTGDEAPPASTEVPVPSRPAPVVEPVRNGPELPEPAEVLEPAPVPEVVTLELPALDASDEFVREQAELLAAEGRLERLLSTDQLLRKLVVMIESVGDGALPRDPVAFLAPREAFSVVRTGDALYVNPESYRRYDDLTATIEAVDASQAVAFLRLVEPLLGEAFAELGMADRAAPARLAEGIDLLLATPIPTQPLALRQPAVMYEYADPSYEALAPAQKLLLRFGPANAARVKAKLAELRALLDAD